MIAFCVSATSVDAMRTRRRNSQRFCKLAFMRNASSASPTASLAQPKRNRKVDRGSNGEICARARCLLWSMDMGTADGTPPSGGPLSEAFDLPGLGNDKTPVNEVTLDACADRLCAVLADHSEPAIVVGHSMGGIIATQGAARCPNRVAALVYITAFLPKDGQSLLDLTKLPEGVGDQVQANIVIEGEPPVAIMPTGASGPALYDCCAEDVAAWAIRQQRPQPVAPFATPVSIPHGALDGINRYYVICTRDRALSPALQRRMIAENPCAEVAELATDHTPQLSMTEELAKSSSPIRGELIRGCGKARRFLKRFGRWTVKVCGLQRNPEGCRL